MKLDVVGAQEAAEICKVERPRISRWKKKGKMPPTIADTRAGPVWRREDVERFAREGKWAGRKPRRVRLVSVREIAEPERAREKGFKPFLDVNASQIGRWRREGRFPEPVAVLAIGPIWKERQIRDWIATREQAAA